MEAWTHREEDEPLADEVLLRPKPQLPHQTRHSRRRPLLREQRVDMLRIEAHFKAL